MKLHLLRELNFFKHGLYNILVVQNRLHKSSPWQSGQFLGRPKILSSTVKLRDDCKLTSQIYVHFNTPLQNVDSCSLK